MGAGRRLNGKPLSDAKLTFIKSSMMRQFNKSGAPI